MKRLILAILFSLFLSSQTWAGDRVGYWNMNEASGNLTDQSGYGNNCTANGGPDYSQAGAPNRGTAIGFDGSTDWFNCGTGSSLDLTGNFTIMVWVYPQGMGVFRGIISHDNGISTAAISWSLQLPDTSPVIRGRISNGTTNNQKETPTYQLNQWYHISFVVSSTQLLMYVNGQAGTPLTRTVYAQSQPTWTIKLGKYGSIGYALAHIDDIKIYNYDLSAIQIQHEYQQSRLAISRKHEPWKWTDLFSLAFNMKGDQIYEKDNRISFLRQHPVN